MDPDIREPSALDKLIEQEARQLLEARMLPNEGPLTAAQRDEVVDALKAYMEKHAIAQADVRRQCPGVGNAVSPILKKTYTHGVLDDHLRELNNWMEVDARRRQTRPHRKYVETHVAKKIMYCASQASKRNWIVVAHGPTGIGKSMVAHVVAEKFPSALYLRIGKGDDTFTRVRQTLAVALRMFSRRKRKDEPQGLTFNQRIFSRLRSTHRLLIIDEAHRLTDSALEFLRDVFDECQVPMLWLCTKDLVDRIRQDSDEDHGQLYRRIGRTCDLVRGKDKTPGGTHPLFTLDEIRKLFESDKVRLAADAQGYLQDVANMLGQGSLARCEQYLAIALEVERAVRGLNIEDVVTVTAAALHKAEAEVTDDAGMMEDMKMRTQRTVAATA
jgi:hypothetical protein